MLIFIIIGIFGLTLGVLIGWLISIGVRRRLKHFVRFLQTALAQLPAGLFYQDLTKKNNILISHTLCLQLNLKMPTSWDQILKKFNSENASTLRQDYQKLLHKGIAFSTTLPTIDKTITFLITGTLVQTDRHQGALVSFQDISELTHKLHLSNLIEQHKNILANALDVLNFPLFIRDSKGLTFFANQAVNLEKTNTLNELNWLSLPFKANDKFYTLTYGQETKTEEELQLILSNMLTSQRRLCEQLPCAICLFNSSGQMLACSSAFADLWHLNRKWIQSQPSYEDYWDAIQDNGLLSRVADFADYKKQQREDFAQLSNVRSVFLYLPDGKIIQRTLIPHIQGSVILLDELQTAEK